MFRKTRSFARPTSITRSSRSHERIERADRVVAVEPDVAREVIARPERDAYERQPALQRDLGDRRERTVAARDPERVRVSSAGELGQVVALPGATWTAILRTLACAQQLVGVVAVSRSGD